MTRKWAKSLKIYNENLLVILHSAYFMTSYRTGWHFKVGHIYLYMKCLLETEKVFLDISRVYCWTDEDDLHVCVSICSNICMKFLFNAEIFKIHSTTSFIATLFIEKKSISNANLALQHMKKVFFVILICIVHV